MRAAEAWAAFKFCTWFLTAGAVHSDSQTSSSSAKAPAATPGFNFNPVSDMTNCTPAAYTWFYGSATDSQPGDLIFIITSDIVGDASLDQVITPVTVDPLARSYTWSSVNATPGGYQLEAKSDLASFLVLSNAFQVKQGSCYSRSSAQKPTKTSSSVGPAASVVGNPGLNFNHTSDMKNCTPAVINWFYWNTTQAQPADLTLTLTSDIPDDIQFDELITTKPLDPLARNYTWSSVSAIPGVYQIAAQSNSAQWTVLSGPFNVTDNSCPLTSGSAISPWGPASSGSTIGSGGARAQNQTLSKAKREAIAGGSVVGGLFVLITVAACVIRRQTRSATSDTPASDISPFTSFIVRPDGTSVVVQGGGKTHLTWDMPDSEVSQSQVDSGKRSRTVTGETMHSGSHLEVMDVHDGVLNNQLVEDPPQSAASENGPEQQLMAIAERVAAMEVQLQTQGRLEEQPPGYDAEPAPPRT
ncbi:hypothetical protein B0H16DRAFT_1470859 [Mycena metata]|uniref:Uncharacterized protein n=1 Tax=Mycena metata TaxID=1033252 RepID=A0AAD7HT45_9AGAR|nr:hypothetical protein B0H16DRAFT_1470859 [Mycena metata]